MKTLLLLIPICLLLNGCPASAIKPTDAPSTPIASAQQAAEKSLYAAGSALKAAPEVLEALYNAGKLSKVDYNNAVPVYNQALASFNVAVDALKATIAIGADPNKTLAYTKALSTFITDKATVDNLIVSLGGAK